MRDITFVCLVTEFRTDNTSVALVTTKLESLKTFINDFYNGYEEYDSMHYIDSIEVWEDDKCIGTMAQTLSSMVHGSTKDFLLDNNWDPNKLNYKVGPTIVKTETAEQLYESIVKWVNNVYN